MAKNKKSPALTYEKPLAIAGTILSAFAVITSLYYMYMNIRFVHDFTSIPYYLNYFITIGGGFLVGFLMTRRSTRYNKLFAASAYALLAMTIYSLSFGVDFIIQRLFGNLPYPWGRITFEGAPLICLIVTVIIGYLLQFRPRATNLTNKSIWTFIFSYLVLQLYNLGNTLYWAIAHPGDRSYDAPLWIEISSILLNPFVVVLVAYLFFGRIKSKLNRLFAATFIAAFLDTLSATLWDLNTEPTLDATNIFTGFVIAITLLTAGLLILKVRTAAKKR